MTAQYRSYVSSRVAEVVALAEKVQFRATDAAVAGRRARDVQRYLQQKENKKIDRLLTLLERRLAYFLSDDFFQNLTTEPSFAAIDKELCREIGAESYTYPLETALKEKMSAIRAAEKGGVSLAWLRGMLGIELGPRFEIFVAFRSTPVGALQQRKDMEQRLKDVRDSLDEYSAIDDDSSDEEEFLVRAVDAVNLLGSVCLNDGRLFSAYLGLQSSRCFVYVARGVEAWEKRFDDDHQLSLDSLIAECQALRDELLPVPVIVVVMRYGARRAAQRLHSVAPFVIYLSDETFLMPLLHQARKGVWALNHIDCGILGEPPPSEEDVTTGDVEIDLAPLVTNFLRSGEDEALHSDDVESVKAIVRSTRRYRVVVIPEDDRVAAVDACAALSAAVFPFIWRVATYKDVTELEELLEEEGLVWVDPAPTTKKAALVSKLNDILKARPKIHVLAVDLLLVEDFSAVPPEDRLLVSSRRQQKNRTTKSLQQLYVDLFRLSRTTSAAHDVAERLEATFSDENLIACLYEDDDSWIARVRISNFGQLQSLRNVALGDETVDRDFFMRAYDQTVIRVPTEEQSKVLKSTAEILTVRGSAGTGKTFCAIEAMRKCSSLYIGPSKEAVDRVLMAAGESVVGLTADDDVLLDQKTFDLLVIDASSKKKKKWDDTVQAKRRWYLVDASASLGVSDEVRGEVIDLVEVFRAPKLSEAASVFRLGGRPTKSPSLRAGPPVRTLLFDADGPIYDKYATYVSEALKDAKRQTGLKSLEGRLAIIVPDEEFRRRLLGPLQKLTSNLVTVGSPGIVFDVVDNVSGFEWLVVIACGLDTYIDDQALETRSRIYRAVTRASYFLLIVNEHIVGGFLQWLHHVQYTPTTLKREETPTTTKKNNVVVAETMGETEVQPRAAEILVAAVLKNPGKKMEPLILRGTVPSDVWDTTTVHEEDYDTDEESETSSMMSHEGELVSELKFSPYASRLRRTLPGAHSGGVLGVASHGGILASCGEDATVRLWRSEEENDEILRGETEFTHVCWGPHGELFAADRCGTVRMWENRRGRHRVVLRTVAHSDVVSLVAYEQFATSSRDRKVRIFGSSNVRDRGEYQKNVPPLVIIDLSDVVRDLATAGSLLVGAMHGEVRFWHGRTGRCDKRLSAPSTVHRVAVGAFIAGACDDLIRVWSEPIIDLAFRAVCLAWLRDILIAGSLSEIRLFSDLGLPVLVLHHPATALTAYIDRLITAHNDDIAIWDITNLSSTPRSLLVGSSSSSS